MWHEINNILPRELIYLKVLSSEFMKHHWRSFPSDCFLFAESREKNLWIWSFESHSILLNIFVPSVLRALRISLATCAGSSFLPVPRTLSEKCVCPPKGLWSAQPIRSQFTSVLASIWTSFWRRDFLLESSEMLWKRYTQSICNWSYTPLCTIFTVLWFAVTFRWVFSSARPRNSFEHWGWGHLSYYFRAGLILQSFICYTVSNLL